MALHMIAPSPVAAESVFQLLFAVAESAVGGGQPGG